MNRCFRKVIAALYGLKRFGVQAVMDFLHCQGIFKRKFSRFIAFFLCRWPTDAPISVSLPPDANEEERRGLEAVMRAWEGAGLGVRFATGASPDAGIEVRFIDPEEGATATSHAANTIADCAVEPEAVEDREPALPPPPTADALLEHARRLAEAGQPDAAADFLEDIEQRLRSTREQLSDA